MNKTKRIFSVIFITILLVLSTTVISLYDNVKDNITLKNNWNIAEFFNEEFQYFTLAMVKEVNPEYEIFSYKQEVPEDIKQQINRTVSYALDSMKYNFQNDSYFVYSVKNSTTNENVMNNTEKISSNDDKSKYNFYSKMICDANGNWQVEGDINNETFSYSKTLTNLLFYSGLITTYDQTVIDIDGNQISVDDININRPTNLEITYIVPEKVEGYGYISSYINSWEIYNGFSAIALLTCTVLLAIFIFCYPIRIVSEVNPFKTIKKWKAEFNAIWLFFGIVLFVSGCMVLMGHTINGNLISFINKFDFINGLFVTVILNYLMLFFTLLVISVALFMIKYILVCGVWRYLKEDTLVGTCLSYLKGKLDLISEIDLSSPINKTIMKYVLLNSLVVMIMILFWGFGIVLVIIYTFLVFFWLKDKILKIQNDYNQLLDATHQLGQDNFQVDIDSDLGIFNSLKDEFNNIKVGFKKAVEEETKSQNMKNELISNVSHDLKTPLTCIKNYIVLLQDDTLSPQTRQEYINSLNQYVNRLTSLIEDLFEVSKANSGNIKLNLIELNIVALLEQTYTENKEVLESKNLTTIKNYANNEIKLNLDGDKTYRIFENLFTNISKYAMVNSRVYLEIKERDDEVIIEFKNISATQMNFSAEEIIERFVRGDKSRHEAGSGLGLAIAKSFTEIQNGKFEIEIDGDLFKVIITFKK
ncbi:MAG: sensor histidine kinase [[Clostridium] spiroforme]|uniref:histidine kinase n=1 Tax=Thomasclavelia spiroformis TaxID=29348 RepID=A0A943EHZ4_9FIRM|nr:sensor histidine kinase [Thomasclavelia spiroformis]MBS5589245.1 sensor histidine kinase [Thomasclavelia spiroformis]